MIEGDGFAGKANELFEGGFSVAESTLGLAGDKDKSLVGDLDLFGIGDFAEMGGDDGVGDAAEIEPLATGEDGGGEFLDLGGGEDELHVGGGLLQRFEESVESLAGEHVNFVDDVDFEFSAGGGVGNTVAEILDLVDAAVGGAVDLEDVETAAFGDLLADVFVGVEVDPRALRAVEGFGEDAGGGSFADAAGTDKEEGMGKAALSDGVREGFDDVFLPDEFREGAGAVFTGEDEIGHGVERLRLGDEGARDSRHGG